MSTMKSSFDFNDGNNLDRERRKPSYGLRQSSERGKRFCESCREMRPKNKKPHVKGWICNECAEGA